MIKRIVFDIDNTILMTIEDMPKCLFIGLLKCKITPTIKLMKQIGYSMQEYEDTFDKYDRKKFIDFFNKKYNLNFKYSLYDILNESFAKYSKSKPNKNVARVLKYLSGKYELVALSNYLVDIQKRRLSKRGLDKYFKEIYGGDVVFKPNKEAYLLACGDKKKEECLFIGDHLGNDYIGPIRFGSKAILYDKKNKYKENNYKKIKDFKELEEML